jgi:hypothetical protein
MTILYKLLTMVFTCMPNLEHFSYWQLLLNLHCMLHYLKDSRKADLIELWSDRLLETLVANHQSSTLDKDCSMVTSKDCTMVWLTGTHHISISKKIWNLQ